MSFDTRPSPARVSAAAAQPFPRAALLALLALFIGTGLVGRDPWYEDAAGFGVMWTMAHGAAIDWVLPHVVGEYVGDIGPLAGWVGAIFVRLFGGWLGDALAARLTTVLWFAIGTASVWYAAYRLARRDEAQPVAFAFGGEALPRDYGRMLADIAALLFAGTLGLVLRVHETNDLAASIALSALTVFGLTLSLERAVAGPLVTGVAIGLMALARGPHAGCAIMLGALLALLLTLPSPARWRAGALAAASASVVFGLWPLAAVQFAPEAARGEYFAAWQSAAQDSLGVPHPADFVWLLRTLAVYAWPLWPFALWALYAWRQGLALAHIALPATLSAVLLAGSLATPRAEESLLPLAAPLAVLAAFGAVSVRRTAESVLDWFAIATVSLFGLVGWAYFIAMMTGTPPKMAASIARLTPGYAPDVGAAAIAIALAAAIGWIALVLWRVLRQPEPLWRGPLLAAAGLTALWFMLNVLFLPAINHARSFKPLAQTIRAQVDGAAVAAPACVLAHQLRPAHRAMLAYHGGIRFGTARDDCPLALQRDRRRTQLDDAPPPGEWRLVWEGRWPPRPEETYRLFRRAAK